MSLSKLSAAEKTEAFREILTMLMGQSFATWYEDDFMDHVEGEENCKGDDEIINDMLIMSAVSSTDGHAKQLESRISQFFHTPDSIADLVEQNDIKGESVAHIMMAVNCTIQQMANSLK